MGAQNAPKAFQDFAFQDILTVLFSLGATISAVEGRLPVPTQSNSGEGSPEGQFSLGRRDAQLEGYMSSASNSNTLSSHGASKSAPVELPSLETEIEAASNIFSSTQSADDRGQVLIGQAYGTAKAGLERFTWGLAAELANTISRSTP